MIYAKVKGYIKFLEENIKEHSREFTATLERSGPFSSAVYITFGQTKNGRTPLPVIIDTSYDITIKRNNKDFEKWIKKYFKEHYKKHTIKIYL